MSLPIVFSIKLVFLLCDILFHLQAKAVYESERIKGRKKEKEYRHRTLNLMIL